MQSSYAETRITWRKSPNSCFRCLAHCPFKNVLRLHQCRLLLNKPKFTKIISVRVHFHRAYHPKLIGPCPILVTHNMLIGTFSAYPILVMHNLQSIYRKRWYPVPAGARPNLISNFSSGNWTMQNQKQIHWHIQHILIHQFAFKFRPGKGLFIEIHQQQKIQTYQPSLKSSAVQLIFFLFSREIRGPLSI